jgi:hypothetical protein
MVKPLFDDVGGWYLVVLKLEMQIKFVISLL